MMLAETPVAQKYLRYRNKKRVANHEPKVRPETQESTPIQNNEAPKLKSMARYRRPKGMFQGDCNPCAAIPTKPFSDSVVPAEIPHGNEHSQVAGLSPSSIQEETNEDIERSKRWKLGQIEEIETVDVEAESVRSQQSEEIKDTKVERFESEAIKQGDSNTCATPHSSLNIQEPDSGGYGSPLSPAQTQKAIERQKLLDLQRLEAELAAAPPSPKFPPSQSPRKNKLFDLISKKSTPKNTPPSTPMNSTPSIMTKSSSESRQSKGIEQGGRGIVPQIDAPISAANAKERRVLIRYKNTSINLPVNLKTTPIDIIQSASDTLTQKITPSTTVLIESYAPLGLSRCLRSFEHVREVMNSWDRDTQNALIIESQDSLDNKFDPSFSPPTAPVDLTFNLYHSQKRGKWKKRNVTLLGSGQMFITKKLKAKSSDKDYTNICHLSDFDIYKLNSPQAQKNLNAPKKYCYAIKSQQKSIMFLNTENFVHYFSTDDDSLAGSFYETVQQWRSWFLANKVEESCNSSKRDRTIHTSSTRASVDDENTKATRTFQPLLDLNSSEDINTEAEDKFDDRPLQIPFLQRSSRQFHSSAASQESAEESGEFPSSSLLGRTYSERKRELEDSTSMRPSTSLRRAGTTKKPNENSPNQRSLLDFTPSPKDLPPWKRPGIGQRIRVTKGVPLIEVATTPGLPRDNMSPPITTIRRDEAGLIFGEKIGPVTSMASEGPFVQGGLISGGFGVLSKNGRSYPSRTIRR
ncbi:hypothetical protein K3495_g9889 [Podosphaera aphanis]|nr:hypothetical protein K3495_g9889 [Podosphaera aphanis]